MCIWSYLVETYVNNSFTDPHRLRNVSTLESIHAVKKKQSHWQPSSCRQASKSTSKLIVWPSLFTVVVWWLQQDAAPAWVPEGQTQPSTASGNPEKDPKKTWVWETHFSKAWRSHSTSLHWDKGTLYTYGMCVCVHQAVAFTIIITPILTLS